MMAKTSSLTALFLVCIVSSAAAVPTEPIGAAVKIINLVTAELNRDTRSLQDGDKVHQNENIEVGADASSEFRLDDDTKLALGPGSRLKLDKFVYDPAKSNGSIMLDLVKGTFRFITGLAAKPTYVLRTPAAAITVRGTIFDIYIQEDNTVWLLLHEGALQACNVRGRCQLLDEPGKLIRITSDGGVGSPVKWAALPGKDAVPFERAFPFVVNTPSIDPNPIFTPDAIILGKLPDAGRGDRGESGGKRTEGRKQDSKPTKKTEKKEPAKKKSRTAKKGSDDDDNIMSGMDIVIGVGVGSMGRRGGHPGGKGGTTGRSGGMDGGANRSGGGMRMPRGGPSD